MADTIDVVNDYSAYEELAELPIWLGFILVWNPKREKFDKLPNNGNCSNISTKAVERWVTLAEALVIKEKPGIAGVTINMTGSIDDGPWRLVGLDFDDVADLAAFTLPFATYAELSPSGKGIRAFCWAPAAYLAAYKDTTGITYPGCAHAEVYFDGTPRHLTVTGLPINDLPIARVESLEPLQLERFVVKANAAAPELDVGAELTLADFTLTPEQHQLIKGTGQLDRSAIMHGLLIKLIDAGAPNEDVLATILKQPHLWQYCLDHRHEDPTRAFTFAQEEIGRAYAKSMTGRRASLLGFNGRAMTSTADAVATAGGVELEAQYLCSDQANAKRLKASHGEGVMFAAGRWYVWLGTHWGADEAKAFLCTTDLSKLIKAEAAEWKAKPYDSDEEQKRNNDIAESLRKWGNKSESLSSLKAAFELLRRVVTVPADCLNRDPYALNVANGTIDLRTGKLRPHCKADRITHCIPIDYEPQAQAPRFKKALEQITGGSSELATFLQRWFGYCATGVTTEQKFAVHHGDGANGKSLLLGIVSYVLGPYAGAAAPNLLMAGGHNRHPTELADLFGKRLVNAQETGQDCELDESTVKAITGGDRIKARGMRQDFYEFEPTHTINLSTNHRPSIKGTDLAMWRRVMLVPYAVTFGTAADVEAGVAQHLRDDRLGEALKAEAAGILVWIVQGAAKWFAAGLNPPDLVLQASAAYREQQDLLGQFLEDHRGAFMDEWVPCSRVLNLYIQWCDREYIDKALRLKRNSLYKAIRNRPGITQDRHSVPFFENGKTVDVPCFFGLKNG